MYIWRWVHGIRRKRMLHEECYAEGVAWKGLCRGRCGAGACDWQLYGMCANKYTGGAQKTKVTIPDSFSHVDLEAFTVRASNYVLKSKESVKLIGNGSFCCQRNKNQKIKNGQRENIFPVIADSLTLLG